MIPSSLDHCEICKEEFKEPKQLPCRHSFCRTCLEQQIIQSQTDAYLCCKTCGSKFRPPETQSATDAQPPIAIEVFPEDHLISSLLQFEKLTQTTVSNGSNISVKCVRHPEHDLRYYCRDCNMTICQLCKNSCHTACCSDNGLTNLGKSGSFLRLHLQGTTKKIDHLGEKVNKLMETVQNKATDLLRKRTEMQIQISAYFSSLRTRMNEHLYELEKQLRDEYANILCDQTDMNKEYLELCESFTERCNSVKKLVAHLYEDYNSNPKNINENVSVLQILSETRIATSKDVHTIDSISSCWHDKPYLEFLVNRAEEEKMFNHKIAMVDVILPSRQRHNSSSSTNSDGSNTHTDSATNEQVDSPTSSSASSEFNVNSQNQNIQEIDPNSGSDVISQSGDCGNNTSASSSESGPVEDSNEETIHPVPSSVNSHNSGRTVLLPTAPPIDSMPDDLPPPYSAGMVGETFSRPIPRPIPRYLIDPRDPPPPYPGPPRQTNRSRGSNSTRLPAVLPDSVEPRNRNDTSVEDRSGCVRNRNNVQLVRVFSVLKEGDTAASSFLRILWVKSNQLLIVDRWNSKVRLFREDGYILSGAAFKGAEPWDITAISDREFGITFPKSKTLCMICLSEKPDIVITSWKNTPCGYISVAYFRRDNVFICGSAVPFAEARVDIIRYNTSQACTLLRSFKIDPYGSAIFQYPRSVKVTEEGIIVVSDYTWNCVTFVSMEGFVVGCYKGTDSSSFLEPMGISIDPVRKEVYIAVLNRGAVRTSSPACIHKVSMEGNLLGIIPKDVGLDRPKELSVFHLSDRSVKLAVTKGNGVIQLFKVRV